MKNKNKIISILMCLSMALASGCSQGNQGEPSETPANTVETEKTGGAVNTAPVGEENTAGTNADETVAEVTEAPDPSSGELFAYYDLLKEEYEKSGRLNSISFSNPDYLFYNPNFINEKILFLEKSGDKTFTFTLHKYDVESKKMNDISFTSDNKYTGSQEIYYDDKDGSIYNIQYYGSTTFDSTTCYIYKYDNSGKLINQFESEESPYFKVRIFSDGTLFVMYSNEWNMYSSDWKTKTEIPVLQADAAHGLKKDISFSHCRLFAKYNNKVYIYVIEDEIRGFYCLNTETMTWEEVKSELSERYQNGPAYDEYKDEIVDTQTVGKYWFINGNRAGIYDMETDTFIATLAYSNFDYNGKDYYLDLQQGVLTKTRCPSDGSEMIKETVMDTGDKQLNLWYFHNPEATVPFNEQYYVFKDQYGYFLREYGKGEDGEIPILTF